MKQLKILILMTAILISGFGISSDGGGGANVSRLKNYLRAAGSAYDAATAMRDGNLPESNNLATVFQAFAPEAAEGDFSYQRFFLDIYSNAKSIMADRHLDTDAIRSLVDEWNKSDAINIQEFINRYSAQISSRIIDSLLERLRPYAKTRSIEAIVGRPEVKAFLEALEKSLEEPIRIRISQVILHLHEAGEGKFERMRDNLLKNQTFQRVILDKLDESMGKWAVKLAMTFGLKKGADLIVPGASTVLTVADRVNGLIPNRAMNVQAGDSTAVALIGATVGSTSDNTLTTLTHNPMQAKNNCFNTLASIPGRVLGKCLRKPVLAAVNQAGKAFVADNILRLLDRVNTVTLRIGSEAHRILVEQCRQADLEAKDVREAYIAEKEEKKRENEARVRMIECIIKEHNSVSKLAKIAFQDMKKLAKEKYAKEIQKLEQLLKEQESYLKSTRLGFKRSPFDTLKAQDLQEGIDAVKTAITLDIKEIRKDLTAAEDEEKSLWKYTEKVKNLQKKFEADKLVILVSQKEQIATLTDEKSKEAKEEKISLQEKIETIKQQIASIKEKNEEKLATLITRHENDLKEINHKFNLDPLQSELSKIKPSYLKRTGHGLSKLLSLADETGVLAQRTCTLVGKQGTKLGNEIGAKICTDDTRECVAQRKEQLKQRKLIRLLNWAKANKKKAIASGVLSGLCVTATPFLVAGAGSAAFCGATAYCSATVLGTASGLALKIAYGAGIGVGLNAGKKVISYCAGQCKNNKTKEE